MSEEVTTEEVKDPQAVLAELRRAQADLKTLREQYAELEKSRDALQATVKTYEEGDNVWKNRVKEQTVKSALGANAERVMKFIDMDSIDFDDEGNVKGLDEAVSKVKADLPELFDPKKRVAGAADLFDKGDVPKKVTGTEAQVARIFRNR